jgi:hypothetical protein
MGIVKGFVGFLCIGVTLLLTACGGGGSSSSPPIAPTASITAAPATISAGSSSDITWSSSGASACTASGAWSGALAASGTSSTGALTANATYSLTCSGPGGASPAVSVTVVVNAVPTVQLSANPSSVVSGGSSTLSWSSSGATSCTAGGAWSGNLAASGSQDTGPLASDSTFSIVCNGPGGASAASTATVGVSQLPPTVALSAVPINVVTGGKSLLTWTSTNATACVASGGWSGALTASGSQSTAALTSPTTYAIACTGPSGTAQASVTVNVVPTASLTVQPSVIASGQTATLTWTSTNATACTASGGWSGTLAASGSQVTSALTSTAAFSLICGGAGGNSAPTSVNVTVSNVLMSITPQTAALVAGASRQFTATVPGDGDATWTVDGIAGGSASVGTISATGLYTAGTSAGTHAVVATSVANTSQSASAVAAVTDLAGVYTYHNDSSRDGANSREYALTPANINASSFGKIASCTVDGAIYGQPLWVANVTIGVKKHNLVIVTTQHDSLYAFDADASICSLLWSASMVDAAHGATAGETSVPGTSVGKGTGDIQPEVGINGTPVIDPATNTLYVAAKSIDPTLTTMFQRLHAIDIATGNEKTASPVLIAGSYPGTGDGGSTVQFNTVLQNQRAALALANGIIYLEWGSHEDTVPWYGWMMGYRYDGVAWTQTAVFNSAPNSQRGGIWMGGGAAPVDSSNRLYVTTGNGNFNATNRAAPNNDYGDSLLQLSPALQVLQFFTPTDQLNDFNLDKDFGSGGAALLADLPAGNAITHALVCGGKDGALYVINRDLLGGLGDGGAVQMIALGAHNYSTPTFWNNWLYAAGSAGTVHSFELNTSTAQFAPAGSGGHSFGFPGATLSVSAAGNQNGVVWAIDSHSYCTRQSTTCGPAVLYAYDASNVTKELWNSSLNAADVAGNAIKFTVPTIANGRVFIGTRGNNAGGVDSSTSAPGELDIYGLTQ